MMIAGGGRETALMRTVFCLLPLTFAFFACSQASREQREVVKHGQKLGASIQKEEWEKVESRVAPGARKSLDVNELSRQREEWAKALEMPEEVELRGELFLTPSDLLPVVWTEEGWRFTQNPAQLFGRDTPRQALRSLLLAVEAKRWDLVLDLAPRDLRIAMTQADIEASFSEGESAKDLTLRMQEIRDHLRDPIIGDSKQAILPLAPGNAVHFEREREGWVIRDF